MAGIEDFVKLWRGNSKLRSGMNFGENRGRYWTNKPDLARYWAQGGSQQQGRLIGDILGKVKSLKIPKKIYERINPDDVWQTMIKDNNLLKKQKTDVLQTIMARAGSLSKLALKGLSVVASLPAQVVVMTLSPTRMGNAEATLEDFAKFADEAQPKEKEKMAAGGNVPSTDIKDYYRRSWGIGDRVPFKYGGTWADWMSNFSDQMTFEEYLRMDLKDKKLHALDRKADGGVIRQGFALGTSKVKRIGDNFGKWLVKDFYTKPGGAMPNPHGSGRNAYFDSKPKALAAIKQRNITMGKLTGRWAGKDLNKFYKDEIKLYGYEGTDWKKIPERIRRNIIAKYIGKVRPKPSIAKWKKEGLSRRVNEETRRLLDLHKPVNPKTGNPYTLKEWSELGEAVRQRTLNELKGKPRRTDRRWADMKEGWYPDKNDNRLLSYMRHAAKQQAELKIPLNERTFVSVYETDPKLKGGKRFIGVREVKTNTLWTHVDYDLSQPGAKIGKVITGHPDMKKFLTFFDEAQKFKYERPTALLKDYFSNYSKVPTYNEIYNFFTMHAGVKPHTLKRHNALTVHHQNLMRNKPTKNFQLLINKYNSEADTILRNSLKKPGQKGYITKAEAIRRLKAIGARVEGMGIKASAITPKKGLALAKKEAVNKFKAAVKNNPAIVDQMAKRLGLDKKQKVILRKRLNSGIPIDTMASMLSSDFRIPVGKIMGALGKVAKVAGVVTLPLDVIPFVQARDLGIENWGEVGAKTWVQELQKLPRTLEDLLHVAGEGTWEDFGEKEDRLLKYKPSTWGDKATVKSLRETSVEDLITSIQAQGESAARNTGVAYGQQVLDPFVGEEETNKKIEKALKQKEWADSLPADHELVKEEVKETVDINETDNIFGTEVPTKNLTGVDQYIINRGI